MQLQLDARTYARARCATARTGMCFAGGACHRLRCEDELQGLDLDAGGASLAAPMPGKVIRVLPKPAPRSRKETRS
jgi:hypothetical protein